jgi:hypothetical protein
MGHDIQCAVCGGPTCGVRFAEPREDSDSDSVKSGRSKDSNTGSDDDDSMSEEGYDSAIVSEEDVRWVERCILLGFNARSTAIDK